MPPPQLRNHPRPSGSAYHGPTTPVGDSHASDCPRSSHLPTSIDRSTSTSKLKPVPVRNSSTRTPRSIPSPSVTSLTLASCSRRPTRRISSRRVSALPLTKGIDLDLGARSSGRDSGHRQVVFALAQGRAGGLEPGVTPVHGVVDKQDDADQQPPACYQRSLCVRCY